jgi:predicted enzyme related to lactoylglutathione lyase
LYVPDLEKGIDYYCNKLGLKIIWKTDMAVGLGMEKGLSEIVIQNERTANETDIKVDSVVDAVKAIKEAGGEIVEGPFDIAIGKCAVIKDPWGNQYVILDSTKGTFITDDDGNIVGQEKT